jgi:hypothetical protein
MNASSLPLLMHRQEVLSVIEKEEKAKRDAEKERNEAVNQLRSVRRLATDALDAMANGANDSEIRHFLRDISAGARRRD